MFILGDILIFMSMLFIGINSAVTKYLTLFSHILLSFSQNTGRQKFSLTKTHSEIGPYIDTIKEYPILIL